LEKKDWYSEMGFCMVPAVHRTPDITNRSFNSKPYSKGNEAYFKELKRVMKWGIV
jgi:hypothetical protein